MRLVHEACLLHRCVPAHVEFPHSFTSVHVTPLPVYPGGQVQLKEPVRSVQ